MSSVLEVKNLTKRFKNKVAVNDISFSIEKGEIVGLLGPNGAGKSTTIEMILGLIEPSEGVIRIFKKDIKKHREEILQEINYSSAYLHLMSRLTVYENLKFFGQLYKVKNLKEKILKLVELLEINDTLKSLFFKLSSGQKTRVLLAKTLINDPKFLLLDEPTASLDPDIAQKVRQILKRIHKQKNISILYTSHNMAEVEEVCHRVIFLQNGRIVASDTPAKLKEQIRDYHLELSFDVKKQSEIISFLTGNNWLHKTKAAGHICVKTNADNLPSILKKISQQEFGIYDIDINKPDLEEVFLKYSQI